ncbi:MAG: hypothetical protein GY828_08550 [Candidatus Gracilibacteria bacterium]|nr:hypothetical protein [Candidatus Gracilibacteria bacterium]
MALYACVNDHEQEVADLFPESGIEVCSECGLSLKMIDSQTTDADDLDSNGEFPEYTSQESKDYDGFENQ